MCCDHICFYASVEELHHHPVNWFMISKVVWNIVWFWYLQSPRVLLWICLLRIRMTLQFLSSGVSLRTSDHPVLMDTPLKSARMEVSPALHHILACAPKGSRSGINTPWQKCQRMSSIQSFYFNRWSFCISYYTFCRDKLKMHFNMSRIM